MSEPAPGLSTGRRPRPEASELLVKETFRTIQGEGPLAGWPAVFVRLAGCPLSCWFCDTDYSEEGVEPEPWPCVVDRIVRELRGTAGGPSPKFGLMRGDMKPGGLVVLTGGEPLAQPVADLARFLVSWRIRVQVETSGVRWQRNLPLGSDLFHVTVSPKAPKLHPKLVWAMQHNADRFSWKFVLRKGETIEGGPVVNSQNRGKLLSDFPQPSPADVDARRVFVQPMDENSWDPDAAPDANEKNTRWCAELAVARGYRLSLQTHKLAGLP